MRSVLTGTSAVVFQLFSPLFLAVSAVSAVSAMTAILFLIKRYQHVPMLVVMIRFLDRVWNDRKPSTLGEYHVHLLKRAELGFRIEEVDSWEYECIAKVKKDQYWLHSPTQFLKTYMTAKMMYVWYPMFAKAGGDIMTCGGAVSM